MEKSKKSNSGFTLVELVVAMAVLAFLMTAVCSLMGSSAMSYKKTKTDINMQTSAQEAYNQLSDSIMQATDMAIVGCEIPEISFDDKGADVTISNYGANVCYVKNEAVAKKFEKELQALFPDGYTISDLKSLSQDKKIAVKAIIVDNAVQIDMDECNMNKSLSKWELTNALTMETVEIKRTNGVDPLITPLLDTYDTCRCIYSFDEDTMYLQRKYAFMTNRNDLFVNGDTKAGRENCIYTEMFSYVNVDDKTVTGCMVNILPEEGSIDLQMYFDENNSDFATNGKVNIRNSFVLKDKKVVLTNDQDEGNNEEENNEENQEENSQEENSQEENSGENSEE